MSYTNETTYYGLPLPTGSDKSTFTDNNTAFQAVDAALHTAYEGAASAAEDITSLTSRVGAAEDDIDALELDLGTEKGKISALQEKETLQDAAIDDVRSDCEGMVSAYNEPTATSTHAYDVEDYFIYNDVLYQATASIAIGDTIVPNTNCKTTTVTNELAQVNSDLNSQAKENYVKVTADSVKTYGQIISELKALATAQGVNLEHWEVMFNFGGIGAMRKRRYQHFTSLASGVYNPGGNTVEIYDIDTGNNSIAKTVVSGNSITITDETSTVPSSGDFYILWFTQAN